MRTRPLERNEQLRLACDQRGITMATPKETTVIAELSALVAGLEKNAPPHSFVVESESYAWFPACAVHGTPSQNVMRKPGVSTASRMIT